MKVIDLFAGTGAFSLAFENKADIVYSNDFVKASKQIYDLNFGHHPRLVLQDLNDTQVQDIPQHDILTGGFPCQPFSVAGHQLGFQDSRSNVFWKILEIIDHHNPKCLILENVKNLVSHNNGNTFKTILNELQSRDYYIHYKILNTSEITGIPQNRERVYIVCFQDKNVSDKFNLNFEMIPKKSVSDFYEKGIIPEKYYYTSKSITWPLISKSVTKQNIVYQYRRVYVRENKNNECPTLTSNMGSGGHNVPLIMDSVGIRKLTPRECFNLQGFPENYKLPSGMADCHLYKLVGNAVSIPVIKLIVDRIMNLMK